MIGICAPADPEDDPGPADPLAPPPNPEPPELPGACLPPGLTAP